MPSLGFPAELWTQYSLGELSMRISVKTISYDYQNSSVSRGLISLMNFLEVEYDYVVNVITLFMLVK